MARHGQKLRLTVPLPSASIVCWAPLAGPAGAAAPGTRCGPVAGVGGPALGGSCGRALHQGRASQSEASGHQCVPSREHVAAPV